MYLTKIYNLSINTEFKTKEHEQLTKADDVVTALIFSLLAICIQVLYIFYFYVHANPGC